VVYCLYFEGYFTDRLPKLEIKELNKGDILHLDDNVHTILSVVHSCVAENQNYRRTYNLFIF